MSMHIHGPAGVRRGYIRDTYINCALDQPLACSIFHAVSAGKPPGAMLLERLTLTSSGAFHWDAYTTSSHSFSELSDYMNTLWLVRRNPRDDSRDQLVPTYLGGRYDPDDQSRYHLESGDQANAMKIFKSIWPGKEQSDANWKRSWRDNWHSLPLHQG
jgi:hypothetical protein